MLGDLLARLTDETDRRSRRCCNSAISTLLETARGKAAAEGIELAACVTQTVQRYASTASDEEWVTLMGMLNRSQDPGATCLRRAFAYAPS